MAQSDVIEFAWEISTKHLAGQHNQKKHGYRGMRVSQAAQAHDFSTIDGLVRFAQSKLPAGVLDSNRNRKLEIELYSRNPLVYSGSDAHPALQAGAMSSKLIFGKEVSDGLVELMTTGQMNDKTADALTTLVHEVLHTTSHHIGIMNKPGEQWAEEAIVESLARKAVEPHYAGIEALRGKKTYTQNVGLIRRWFSSSEIEKMYFMTDEKRVALIKKKIRDEFARNAERLQPGLGDRLRKDIKDPLGMLHKPVSDFNSYDKVTRLRLFLTSVDAVMGLKTINFRDY